MTTSRTLLPLVLSTINTTLTSLRTSSVPPPSQQVDPTSTLSIRSDFLVLLSLISKQSTNYTLALKNPPEEKAVVQTLERFKDGVEKLGFLEELLRERPGELDKRLRWSLIESLESISSFLSLSTTYLPPNPTTISETHRKQLLSSCKTLWKVIETIEKDLPENELGAVRKSWKDVMGLLEDCETEIRELIRNEPEEKEGEGEEDREEEDDQDEEGEDGPMSERAKSIISSSSTILKLSRLLINRLLALTAPTTKTNSPNTPLPAKFDSVPFLSNLTKLIKRFSEKADDLAGVLEEVEDGVEGEEAILVATKNEVEEIVDIGEDVAREIEEALEGDEDVERRGKVEGWFKVWRLQRDQAKKKLLEDLK